MNRIVAVSTTVVGMALAAVPAVAGLRGNPSFSHQLPVRVPSQAQAVNLVGDDHPTDATKPTSTKPTSTKPTSTKPTSTKPTSTKPSTTPSALPTGRATTHPEPGDDHGGATTHPEPSDDHGGATTTPKAGDDHGGHGGRGGRRHG